ncbi:unnamed protein product [Cylicostephanus goldi]|uniref:G-protein coupled receptors family 1 profile domain-containing protein n=1 Tax=Cylicostephanus goldi TaxID=71465 RepID=A0A3P6SDV2_CYLGO|nr:unnamed protein product [Cylicostephanus goldi]
MYYLSNNDIAYIVALAILTAWSIFANAFLLYMIVCRSPKNLSPYRIFLGNAALTQLLLSIDIIVVAPR